MAVWKKPLVWCDDYERDVPYTGVTSHVEGMLKKHFNLITPTQLDMEPQRAKDIEAVISFVGHGELPQPLQQIQKLAALKVVVSLGSGVNHLAEVLPRLKGMGVRVAYTPTLVTKATADMAMGLLLASARNIIDEVTSLREGELPRFNYLGEEVNGASLGIVGMGRVGLEIARRASWGFNMSVVYHNRSPRSEEDESSVQAVYYSSLEDMLPKCDYVIVCCPLTDETRYLVGEEELCFMKKTATLINMSRGPVVDTDALVDALRSGKLRGAALDVTDPDPLPLDHPLLSLPRVTFSPHRGTASRQTRDAMWKAGLEVLKGCLIDKTGIPQQYRYKL